MINLSKTSKMPCKSWSLPAITTCPGAHIKKGLVKACQGCYATQGFYLMPGTKRVRDENREGWKDDNWVSDMVARIGSSKFFRWFDSGDVYHPRLAFKIQEVVTQTPETKHWMPTRSYKVKKIKVALDKMNKLCDNIVIRYSSDSVSGGYNKRLHGSTIIHEDKLDTLNSNVHVCQAYLNNGKCGDCRACWDKTIPVIAYVAHTNKMEKVINDHSS